MAGLIKNLFSPSLTKILALFYVFFLFSPLPAWAWGVGEKDIKDIRNDMAILYEKLNTMQKDNEVLLRNQASQNVDIASIRDDAQQIQTKLDELTQFLGIEMNKNAKTITQIQEKLNIYAQETPGLLQKINAGLAEIKESNLAQSTTLSTQKEEGQVRMAALDEKLSGLVNLLKTFFESEKANREKREGELKGTADKVAELVKISKEALQELSKKPEAQAKQLSGQLGKIDKSILDLVEILKSNLVENSKAMKNNNDSILKLIKSIDQQLAELSGGKKKPK